MKIVDLHIEGFRSLKDVSWKPGDLNLIIGPNGSGKSNLLKALEMLSDSARGRLADQVTREGGMDSLVWDGEPTGGVQWALHFQPAEPDEVKSRWSYELEIQRLGAGSAYQIEQEELGYNPDKLEFPDYLVRVFWRKKNLAALTKSSIVRQPNKSIPSKIVVPGYDQFPLENTAETILAAVASPFTNRPRISAVQKAIAGWSIYQDFQTHHDAPVRRAPVTRREATVAADGSNLVQVLHTLYTGDRQFKQDLDLAMRAAFNEDYEEIVFPPDADQRIQLRLLWKGLKHTQSAADLSDGTLRFLYLIAILANPNPPTLIAIDEPEMGLHPSMLPIIAEYARDASKRTQVILTTHSAELLDAFSEYSPTVTVAKWADGQTQLNVLSGESLRYWLQDYTLGKLYRSGELEDLS
jgi:predicted ATPase